MKNDNENIDMQLAIDGITQTLEEIKEAVLSKRDDDSSSALTVDLLNKISETIDNAKKAINEEDLKKFLNVVISVTTELQEKANKAFAEFLNQKIEELREIAKQPSVVQNHYSIDFKSSKMFIVVVLVSIALLGSLFGNYSLYQKNKQLTDNNLKYRYIKMKNGIFPDEISRLENFFYYQDSAYVVKNIRKDVIDYEHRIKEQARILKLKRQQEKSIEKLDKEIERLK